MSHVLLTAVLAGFLHEGDAASDRSVAELLDRARTSFSQGSTDDALALAGRAIEADPKNARPYHVRGAMFEDLKMHREAVADYDRVLELEPGSAEVHDRRGSERFKLGDIAGSITDFDKAIELDPAREAGHWKRGISCYYAGRYEEGRRQFEGYQTVDDNDVENAVWRYLCMARSDGVERARQGILKIKLDRRVPMMQIHALFSGRATPDDVLAAAGAGDPPPDQLKERLFYAHLYLGLYHEAAGQPAKARGHIVEAAEKHPIGHYMWDVARVHAELKDRPAAGRNED